MRISFSLAAALAAVFALFFTWKDASPMAAADAKGPLVVHNVYFKLKDGSPESVEKMVAACDKYLAGHKGVVFYAAGPLAEDFRREVNDTDFHVGLHIVFEDKAAHDTYQSHERHVKFIDENKAGWAGVRVFDSYVDRVGK